VIALCVVRDGILPLGSEEAIDEAGGRAVLVGSGTEAAADVLEHAATELVLVECGAFRPAAWALGLAPLLREENPIILPASADGRDLAPRVAHALGRPLFAPTIGASDSLVTVVRGGGFVLEDVEGPGPFVATLEPGCRGRDPERADSAARRFASVVVGSERSDPGLIAVRAPDPATVELGEATRIMAGGAGLGRAERMDALGRLAGRLGCALGATRVVADAGWVDFERQIGTTGAVVNPDLYIAVGISGALQHVSGLGHPRDIVSINHDPSCPMMALADLAIVADAPGFVDALGRRLGIEAEELGA
jgi:electron transfer flavoprotein alpha subunit